MLKCISLHAHAYELMLCIVFMEVSGGQLTKYISGGKMPFQQVAWWTTSFIFLILTLAAAQQVFFLKNTKQGTMHLMQWQRHSTVTGE